MLRSLVVAHSLPSGNLLCSRLPRELRHLRPMALRHLVFATLRPRWDSSQAIPAGYRVERRVNRWLILACSWVFGIGVCRYLDPTDFSPPIAPRSAAVVVLPSECLSGTSKGPSVHGIFFPPRDAAWWCSMPGPWLPALGCCPGASGQRFSFPPVPIRSAAQSCRFLFSSGNRCSVAWSERSDVLSP